MNLTPSEPTAVENQRIFSLDALRGLAILGISIISVWEFGGFGFSEQLFYHTGTHGGNLKLLNGVSTLFEGKMRALLALVFGAGIVLFLRRKQHPAPIGTPDAYIRKMLWLMAFGLLNAFILLWPGDILFQLGVMGILLYPFHRMKTKGLFIAAIFCTLVYCGKQFWNYADDKKDYKKYKAVTLVEEKFKADSAVRAKSDSLFRARDSVAFKDSAKAFKLRDSLAKKNDTLTNKQQGEKGKWEGMVKSLKYDSAGSKMTRELMQSGWGKIAYNLMKKTQYKESYWLYQIGIWDLGSMIFLGMALLGLGFFTGGFSKSKYLLVAIACIFLGLAMAWWRIRFQGLKIEDYELYVKRHALPYNFFFPIERMLLAVGYASLATSLLPLAFFSWIRKAFVAVGRMALSNYILQTLVCSFFFYGYGFGYWGKLNQWQLYFFVAELALAQIVFSVFWLKYYQLGPVEWLWKSLVYKKRIKNRLPGTDESKI